MRSDATAELFSEKDRELAKRAKGCERATTQENIASSSSFPNLFNWRCASMLVFGGWNQ